METSAVRRDEAILEAMILNEQSRELTNAVEAFRVHDHSDLRISASSLVSYADFVAAEARDRMFDLIRKYPENHGAVLCVLRTVLEWTEKDRRSDDLSAGQKRDLDFAQQYVWDIARAVLRQSLWLTPDDARFLNACGIAADGIEIYCAAGPSLIGRPSMPIASE